MSSAIVVRRSNSACHGVYDDRNVFITSMRQIVAVDSASATSELMEPGDGVSARTEPSAAGTS